VVPALLLLGEVKVVYEASGYLLRIILYVLLLPAYEYLVLLVHVVDYRMEEPLKLRLIYLVEHYAIRRLEEYIPIEPLPEVEC
jgi:hypothetical protein